MAEAQTRNEWSFDELVKRAGSGEALAFEILYRTYAGRVRAFAEVRGSADADAVTNDVMLRVFRNLKTFEGDKEAFLSWLYTIARNCIIDDFRKSQRRPATADADVPEIRVVSAEETAMSRLSKDDVLHMLSLLTVDQREVIALRLIEDLSLNDVAKAVGRPVSAVKSLQQRGLRRLEREAAKKVIR